MTISQFYKAAGPIGGVQSKTDPVKPDSKTVPKGNEFQKELEKLVDQNVQVSKHAANRIKSRELAWDQQVQDRIVNGMDKAESKGSKEALILADDVAVIANVKSRTIVTAMDRTQLKDRIFTNIDSTVLV